MYVVAYTCTILMFVLCNVLLSDYLQVVQFDTVADLNNIYNTNIEVDTVLVLYVYIKLLIIEKGLSYCM